eukprot:3377106-Pleurochrysis_carterae.AAC.1
MGRSLKLPESYYGVWDRFRILSSRMMGRADDSNLQNFITEQPLEGRARFESIFRTDSLTTHA